jgi:pyruvate dehydrogenase (quinone)
VSGNSATDSGRSGNRGQAVVKEIPREEALSADRPVGYEAIVDAEVPPMPPHTSFDQAKSITRALYRGDPAADILRHSFAELVEEYIPHS